MEANNLPVAAKKIWSIVGVLYIMLRKGISKRKLMVDLNMMIKCRKIAGKALHNLIFHPTGRRAFNDPAPPPGEYEFSCSNTPAYPALSLFFKKHRKNQAVNYLWGKQSAASPAFGRSPMVRQLRITDSPFPLRGDVEEEEDSHVDEAAEEFIMRFYKDLKKQAFGN